MSEYARAHCWACNAMTTFDPELVPRVNGHPLCLPCVTRVNELLTEATQRPVTIEEGTYEEPKPWDIDPDAVEKWMEE